MRNLPLGPVVPYITLGDPDIPSSVALAQAMVAAGCPVIELGVPFSDPIADGPVIQTSHQRALLGSPRPTLSVLFDVVPSIRAVGGYPVAMCSANLVLHYGIDGFFRQAAACQLAGALIPDLSIEDAAEWVAASHTHGVPLIWMVSPLVSAVRLPRIVAAASGFIYVISSTGTTGVRDQLPNLSPLIQSIRAHSSVPIAVGFGINRPDQVKQVLQVADAAVVGSHLVDQLMRGGASAALEALAHLLPPRSEGRGMS